MTEELKTPSEWEKITKLRVVDPDGWRYGIPQDWGTPISREEWDQRIATSTVDHSQRYAISDATIQEAAIREEAMRILESCDPGECGCGEPHRLPEEYQGLIGEMVELLKKKPNS